MSCEGRPLLRYSRGELGSRRAGRLAAHLDECVVCSQRLLVLVALAEGRRVKALAARRRWWIRAAALLLMATVPPVLYRYSVPPEAPSAPSSWAVTEAYPLIPLRNRSGSDPLTREGYGAYLRGDFARAETLLRGSGAERDLLLRGVSLYMLGREGEAASLLARIPRESVWHEPACWYEANARIRLGEFPASRGLLRKLAGEEGEYSLRAADLLQKLEGLP